MPKDLRPCFRIQFPENVLKQLDLDQALLQNSTLKNLTVAEFASSILGRARSQSLEGTRSSSLESRNSVLFGLLLPFFENGYQQSDFY